MIRFNLAPPVCRRLAEFLKCNSVPAARSGHWQHFSGLNRIRVDLSRNEALLEAGAGFDSSYELNFRPRSLAERLAHCWLNLRGLNPDTRFSRAFFELWPGKPPVDARIAADLLGKPLTAHKFLAAHYANLLLPALPATASTSYVEIGPGSGYLAALIHRHRPGRLILIDLPEILPYSFLMLHRIFPDSPFLLPNELEGNPVQLPDSGFVFLTADQSGRLPDHCMDIGVNTASFGEMLPGLVAGYFTLLRRIARPDSLFFTCNRVEKWMDDARDGRATAAAQTSGYWLRFDGYPWSRRDRDVFYGPSAFHDLVQPQNPMMQRLCQLAPPDPMAAIPR